MFALIFFVVAATEEAVARNDAAGSKENKTLWPW